MAEQEREQATEHMGEDHGSRSAPLGDAARDVLEHVVGAGVEAEIAAARTALEEARALLEGALRKTGEAVEEVVEGALGDEPDAGEAAVPP